MTLVLKLDPEMVKMFHHTKYDICMSKHSNVITPMDRQTDTHTYTHAHTHTRTHTDRQYENITLPPTRAVKISMNLHKMY